MKKEIQLSIIHNRKKTLNDRKEAPVEIVAYFHRKRKYFSTGVLVQPNHWDGKHNSVKDIHPESVTLNQKIKNEWKKLDGIATLFFKRNETISLTRLNELYRNDEDVMLSFSGFVKTEMENDFSISEKTKVSHRNTMVKFKSYNNDKEIMFSDLSYSFMDGFMNYLRKDIKAPATIDKCKRNIRRNINVAIRKGIYLKPNPCNGIKIKIPARKMEVLTIEDIRSVEALDLSMVESKISIVRDMFLFACYTGLRISDATRLSPKDVRKDGENFILDFITYKPKKHALLPLSKLFPEKETKYSRPEIILIKYYDVNKELVFPKLSESYINENLKGIALSCGLKMNLTFEYARHTFGTILAGKIAPFKLMALMQHSDIKTTMRYVHLNKEMVEHGLLKIDWE
ncbi:MAG: site-specific integrase [Bacteroidetes bacterium]|nr:site-specific integrase [Bacteroidota bacterium]